MNENACGVIVAAGNGTRLKHLTENCPKPLVLVDGEPMILLPILSMIRAGISDIGIVIQPRFRDQFEAFLAHPKIPKGVTLTLIEQDQPKGMAYAVSRAKEFVQNRVCMVLAGDSVNSFDFSEALQTFEDGATIFARRENNADIQKSSGMVQIDEHGKVLSLVEKPEIPVGNLCQIGGGIYQGDDLMRKIEALPKTGLKELDITQVHNVYLQEENVRCVVMPDGTYYNNVTHPADVDAASEYVRTHPGEFTL
ncbi:sugar nucleotidyltransferase [Candidatus Gracilibacteria bacterium]|nr:sugar nucleotidyltransferase [Candidatus Gracilibacteria bacterium]